MQNGGEIGSPTLLVCGPRGVDDWRADEVLNGSRALGRREKATPRELSPEAEDLLRPAAPAAHANELEANNFSLSLSGGPFLPEFCLYFLRAFWNARRVYTLWIRVIAF